MNFDDFDKEMRRFEESIDQIILPDYYMVARLDGRSFTKLTKNICKFEAPFDVKFKDMMDETVKALMSCGFRVVYGYTESDEISLLFHPDENTFGRKVRKYNSILAGTASAAFSINLGRQAVFDCRMIPLPSTERVVDYFLWRQEDAHRNALNSHCYWQLRREGLSIQDATKELKGKSVSFKNEFLYHRGINFGTLPNWQKRGTGMWYENKEIAGINPLTNKEEMSLRRELHVEEDLPLGAKYADLIEAFLKSKDQRKGR